MCKHYPDTLCQQQPKNIIATKSSSATCFKLCSKTVEDIFAIIDDKSLYDQIETKKRATRLGLDFSKYNKKYSEQLENAFMRAVNQKIHDCRTSKKHAK